MEHDLSPDPPRRAALRLLGAAALGLGCIVAAAAAEAPLRIAVTPGPMLDVVEFAAERAKQQGLEVKLVEFSDWVMPNEAVATGEVDANLFQHIPFLNAAIKARNFELVPVASVLHPAGRAILVEDQGFRRGAGRGHRLDR